MCEIMIIMNMSRGAVYVHCPRNRVSSLMRWSEGKVTECW